MDFRKRITQKQEDSEARSFPLKEETHQVIGAAFEVHDALGCGLLEKPYENALVVELCSRSIPFAQQRCYPIAYKSVNVGHYTPDLVVFDSIIVEIKAIEQVGNIERAQVLNYLRISKLKLGLILNFKHPRLQHERIAL